jgi:hypothetical protein
MKTITLQQDIINYLKESKDKIDLFTKTKKELYPSSKKHYNYTFELLYFVYYRISKSSIYYNTKQTGTSLQKLCEYCYVSSPKKMSFILDILIHLDLIERTGTPAKDLRSYKYPIIPQNIISNSFIEIIYNPFKGKQQKAIDEINEQIDIFDKTVSNDNLIPENYNKAIIPKSYNFISMDNNYDKVFLNLYKQKYSDYLILKEQITNNKSKNKIIINKNLEKINNVKKSLSNLTFKNDTILNQNYLYSVSSIMNRRYNVFCNLNKEFLEFLRIDNEKTIGIDIKNAHPSFFANELLFKGYDKFADVKLFIELCLNNTVYEYFNNNILTESKNIKLDFLKMINGNNRVMKINEDEARILNIGLVKMYKVFPNVVLFIEDYNNKNGIKSFGNHLKKLESKLVNKISNKLEMNNIHNITRYDEWRIPQSKLEESLKIIKESIKELELNLTLSYK